MSTGVPSCKNGISSTGNIFETIPLFPCLPAILSPTSIFLSSVIYIDIMFIVCLFFIVIFVIIPEFPFGIFNDVSLTKSFSKIEFKILFSKFFSLFSLVLPIKISSFFIFEPNFIIPFFLSIFRVFIFILGKMFVIFS
jgi:predicted transglutaminase-like protease